MKKKLLLLGGSRYLLPVIEKAHALGLYVITCDYLPHNAAHPFADEYANVSIIAKDNVLAMAREKKIVYTIFAYLPSHLLFNMV